MSKTITEKQITDFLKKESSNNSEPSEELSTALKNVLLGTKEGVAFMETMIFHGVNAPSLVAGLDIGMRIVLESLEVEELEKLDK